MAMLGCGSVSIYIVMHDKFGTPEYRAHRASMSFFSADTKYCYNKQLHPLFELHHQSQCTRTAFDIRC